MGFGLIDSTWGGTRIEAWSPQQSLANCQIEDFANPNRPQDSNSHLYNAMIHPLTKLAIKGVLWYQGEGNTL